MAQQRVQTTLRVSCRGASPAPDLQARRYVDNVESFLPSGVPRRDSAELSALDFHREFVAKSAPVVLTGQLTGWPDLSPRDLAQEYGEAPVRVPAERSRFYVVWR